MSPSSVAFISSVIHCRETTGLGRKCHFENIRQYCGSPLSEAREHTKEVLEVSLQGQS